MSRWFLPYVEPKPIMARRWSVWRVLAWLLLFIGVGVWAMVLLDL